MHLGENDWPIFVGTAPSGSAARVQLASTDEVALFLQQLAVP